MAAKASLIEMRPLGTALGRGDGRCPAVPRPAAEGELRRGKPTHRAWPCHSPSTGLARNTRSVNGPHLPQPPHGNRTCRGKKSVFRPMAEQFPLEEFPDLIRRPVRLRYARLFRVHRPDRADENRPTPGSKVVLVKRAEFLRPRSAKRRAASKDRDTKCYCFGHP